jgi:DNA-binding SARP family transcriptional activator/class 3 adenylate cyclase/DNA polymerase III delta prime subunit
LIAIPSTTELEFRILGALEVFAGAQRLSVPKGKRRLLLADLLAHVDATISTERLIYDLWGDDEPETARSALQVYVSQLRRLLEGEGRPPRLLVTDGGGYSLRISPERVDARRFERLAREGRQALDRGACTVAVEKLDNALQEWRGPALAEFHANSFAQALIAQLENVRLQALEDRVEANLSLGRHAEVIGELCALVQEHPLRERLRAQLMLALYRAGRQADALEEYRRARAVLVEQHGLEPGPGLRELEAAILRQDPTLELSLPRRSSIPPNGTASQQRAPSISEVSSPAAILEPATRKTVSVLVAELVRSPRGLQPERVGTVLRHFRELIATTVKRYGGTVDSYTGDSALVVFGIPALHEDDPLRCLHAALEIKRTSESLAADLADVPGASVNVRLAIETGDVVAEPGQGRSRLAGDVLSLAAQLARAAAPGEVHLGAELERRIREKGQVHRTAPFEAPFVGRHQERQELHEALEDVLEHRACRLAILIGAPGVGKSRLAQEYSRALDGKAKTATGHCVPFGEEIALGPLRGVVTQIAGDPPDLDSLLLGADEANHIASRVSGSLGFSGDQAVGDDTFWALRRFFETCARRQPLILVLEDLHWAKPRLLDFVEHLVDWSRDAPLLVVGVARPELLELRPTWTARREAVKLFPVEPLSGEESEQLATSMRVSDVVDEETFAHIVERAEGNPLFLEQMLAMAETGVPLQELDLPPTIAALLAARLDALPQEERVVLSHAAVVGRAFGPRQLKGLLPDGVARRCEAALDALIRKSFIEPHGLALAGLEAFRFRHVLIRDVAYESLSKSVRSHLHESLADWIEHSQELERDTQLELAGHHLELAYRLHQEVSAPDERSQRLRTRAGDRLANAGRRALERDLRDAEAALLLRAVDVLPRRNGLRLELLPELAEILTTIGDLESARSVLAEAQELVGSKGDPGLDAHTRLVEIRFRMRTNPSELTTEEILEQIDHVIPVLGAESGQDRRLSSAWNLRGFTSLLAGQARIADAAALRAAEYARRANDLRAEVRAFNLYFGAALLGPLHAADAFTRCQENMVRVARVRWAHGSAHLVLAVLSAMQVQADAARRHLSHHRQLMEDLGEPILYAAAGEMRGRTQSLLGDAEAAEREFRTGYETLGQRGERGYAAQIAALLADALCARGRFDEARELAEKNAEDAGPDLAARIAWLGVQAKLHAHAGSRDEAEGLARAGVALARDTDYLLFHADALVALAEILAMVGRPLEASSQLLRAVDLYERKGNVVSAREARTSITMLRRRAGRSRT